ncbi:MULTISPECIES: response regulator [unclassified Enterococcus]|uniref:LytR/AlgR family response regulator transcription factor n=1 Tax=unclassified Enterococcus TaxID=2608891 RepID=UPI0013ED118A|nr:MULTISPECIES: response regulator [unclassified Enterococcus]
MKKYFVIEDNHFHSDLMVKELINNQIENITRMSSLSEIKHLIQLEPIDNQDVFFIDIDLKQSLTGLDVAEAIRKKNAHTNIVFFTAYANYAVETINRRILPIGYIKKEDDLARQVKHVLQQIDWKEQQIVNIDRIVVEQKGGSLVLYPREILYIESIKGLKNQVLVKTTTEDKLINTSLKSLKLELEKYPYFLLLKSYCLNLSQLQRIDSTHYILEFFTGDSLLVGRKIFEKVKEGFLDYQHSSLPD